MAEEKKPLSLNERHNRLVEDLSASHPRKPPPSCTGERMPSKIKLEGRRRLCKASTADDADGDAPRFSEISDFDSPPKFSLEEKPGKIKIEGKRRLCKASDVHDGADIRAGTEEPNFSILSDFESPIPEKNAIESKNDGGSEIRDILNELSSKLDFLTIEKKSVSKTVNSVGDSVGLVKNEVNRRQPNSDLCQYKSASSSLLLKSHQSDSSSDVSNQFSIKGGVETLVDFYQEETDVPNESRCSSSVINVLDSENVETRLGKTEPKMLTVKSGLEEQPFVCDIEDDDDCIVLSNKKDSKAAKRGGSAFEDVADVLNGFDGVVDWKNESYITLSGPKSTYKLPGHIAKMLYPHQRDGVKWLWSLYCQGKGGILGDDMGLGKTMQICGYLAGLFNSHLIKRALIVAPKTLLPHWLKELSVVGLSGKTREYYGTSAKTREYELQYILQDKGVLLTTYDILRNNSKSLRGDHYYHDETVEDTITWDYLILDEGHLIKNPSTQRAKSLLEIPSVQRIIISGTPIQNNLKELWALFNFCCPELLGDKNWFKEKYEYPILRGNDKSASDRDKRIGSTVAKELRERIQPYFLRRLKNEVFLENDDSQSAKLSKKNEIIVWLRLTSCQRQLYEAFLSSELVLSAFDGSPLAALTILKKLCDHPLLLTKRAAEDVLEGMDSMLSQEDHGVAEKLAMHIADITETDDFQEKHDYLSCKIYFIMALLDNLIPEGHNVLIFSQTRKMLNLIQESLISKGYKFLRIDGTTKATDRLKIVNDFQEGMGPPIFLLTSQVGGLGLTLTKADRVIVVDPAWNPSTDNQSVDRAYRIGQKKDVLVYRLMTCGTVEEKIYKKQIFKGGLFKTATEHKEQIRYFSQQDLRELLSLPKQGFDVSLTQQQLHEEHDHQHTIDGYLKAHIKFLDTLGIAGVSHHSLLFSKTAPVPVVQEDDEAILKGKVTHVQSGKSSSNSSLEQNVDGAEFAFNPKEVRPYKKSSSASGGKPTESEIKERINRLSHIFADKVTISKLPDKGEKIQKQIADLNLELEKMRTVKITEKEVIDLDDITGAFQEVLNV